MKRILKQEIFYGKLDYYYLLGIDWIVESLLIIMYTVKSFKQIAIKIGIVIVYGVFKVFVVIVFFIHFYRKKLYVIV